MWMLGMTLGLPAAPGMAQEVQPAAAPAWHFIDLWLTRDQQGRRAFEHGDFAAAAERFEDPMWRGIAQYRAGRFADALQSFGLVDSAESDFNQGDTLAQMKRYKEAAARYAQALARRPGWKEASANLALMKALTPPDKKDDPHSQEEAPDMPPDQIQFDKKGQQGQAQTQVGRAQSAEAWMRNIQTTPTELLARKFVLQAQTPAPGKENKP